MREAGGELLEEGSREEFRVGNVSLDDGRDDHVPERLRDDRRDDDADRAVGERVNATPRTIFSPSVSAEIRVLRSGRSIPSTTCERVPL